MYRGPPEGQSSLAEPVPVLSKSQPLELCGVWYCLPLEQQSVCPGLRAAGSSWNEMWGERERGEEGNERRWGRVRDRGGETVHGGVEEGRRETRKNSAMQLQRGNLTRRLSLVEGPVLPGCSHPGDLGAAQRLNSPGRQMTTE